MPNADVRAQGTTPSGWLCAAALMLALTSIITPPAVAQTREHLGLAPPAGTTFPSITVNDNRAAAGRLNQGIVTVKLEARPGTWFPEGDEGPGVGVFAFPEEGGPLLNPGPLIRVTQGTVVLITVKNALAADTITISG